jgi:hypothetical protein
VTTLVAGTVPLPLEQDFALREEHEDSLATALKTEQIKEEEAGQCYARTAADDAEMSRFAGAAGGGGLTLGALVTGVWEGLHAAGVAGCPACGGRMERVAGVGRCGGCGSALS